MPRISAMRALKAQERQEPAAEPYTIPAPVGGLNARDAIANMPETDAIILDNWFPQPSWVEFRRGYSVLGTFSGYCPTLAAYNSIAGTNQLYAAVNRNGVGSIYRVDNTAGGPVGAPVVGGSGPTVQAITNAVYDWVQFGTGSAEILYLVNGSDNPLLYDGTTWYAITNVSAPYALTNGPSPLSSLSQVVRYKSRLWFVQANSFNVYYLPQNVFAGALTLLPLGPNFQLGGFIQTVVTVSIDNSAGLNDYIAFVSNQGEVVVFQGYDPFNVNTFFESAHFRIGRPLAIGRRAWQKIGSDAAIICVDGVMPMSKALLTDRSQEQIALSDKIRSAFNADAQTYGAIQGWQIHLHPSGTKLLVNVPTSVNSTSYQYVQNTLSGAWCTFNKQTPAWNALCFEEMGDNLYFGGTGFCAQADTGTSDGGSAITFLALPAFTYFGQRGILKMVCACQPIFQANGTVTLGILMNMNYEFSPSTPFSSVTVSVGQQTLWGSPWGSPWSGQLTVQKPWVGVAGSGYAASMAMKIAASSMILQWQVTNFLFKPGSAFYG